MRKPQQSLGNYLTPRCRHNVGEDTNKKIIFARQKNSSKQYENHRKTNGNNTQNSDNRFTQLPKNMPYSQHAMTQIRPALIAALPRPTLLKV